MIFSPPVRLLLLALAAYFVVHALASCAVWLVSSRVVRRATRLPAADAARRVFALRLLPSVSAALAVLCFALPGYILWEPANLVERMGWVCFVLAVTGALLWMDSMARVAAGVWRTARFTAQWKRGARVESVGRRGESALVAESSDPVLALVGIVRPQIVISAALLRELSPEQLDAAIEHEKAHRVSRENLKRLALLAAPDALPFCRTLRTLNDAWLRFAEWSADDAAVCGDEERSLSLATALVRVARMGATPQLSPLTASLVSTNQQDLAERVARLTGELTAPGTAQRARWMRVAAVGAFAALAWACLQPATFSAAHRLLEFFSHQ